MMTVLRYLASIFKIIGNTIQTAINLMSFLFSSRLVWGGILGALLVVFCSWYYFNRYRVTEAPVLFVIGTDTGFVDALHCSQDRFGEPERFRVDMSILHGTKETTHRQISFAPGNACMIGAAGIKRDGWFFKRTKNIVTEDCTNPEVIQMCAPLRQNTPQPKVEAE